MKSYYDLNPNNLPLKEDDNIDLNLINIANMNEIVFSTPSRPLIGTYALATCVGIIITDDNGNYSLGHILNNYDLLIHEMLKKMQNINPIKIILIPGIYTTNQKLKEIIKFLNICQKILNYNFEIQIKDLRNFKNRRFHSIEFAFDTRTKEYLKPNYDELILQNRRR